MRDYPPVTVLTTPTLLARGTNDIVFLQNDGPDSVYLGGTAVTSASGQSVAMGEYFTIDANTGDTYGVVATGKTAVVRVAGQRR